MIDRHFRFEADDVERDVVGYPTGPVRGKAAARGFYDSLFNDLAGEKVATLRRYHGPDFVADESLWEGRATATPFGIPGHGRRLAFRLPHVFDMTPGGQIKRENVWLDFAAILQQLNAPRDA
jgi:hypothetical protein